MLHKLGLIAQYPRHYQRNMVVARLYHYLFPKHISTLPQHRYYSTNNPDVPLLVADTFHPRLVAIIHQLDAIAPRFILRSGDITILSSPDEFYTMLKTKILGAKSRVFLSSLYIGKSQHELIRCLESALDNNESLSVHILTDALRGTREAPHNDCSALLLAPLVEKYGKHRVDLRMYHTPHLAGFTRSIAPKRFNEAYGLQHMKLYGFDDEIMLSGANLSHDYFTDRQDRYYLFSDRKLTEYYFRIHEAVSSVSYRIVSATPSKNQPNFHLDWPTSNKSCEPHLNTDRFVGDTSLLLGPLLKQHELGTFEEFSDADKYDTLVYPVSQFTPLFPRDNDQSTEKPALLRLLSYLDSPTIKWWFTAGYFNMLPQIQDRLLGSKAHGSVITASPKANSFYQSAGVLYYLPEAYLLFAKRFLEEVSRVGKSSLITVYEWQRGIVNTANGWSYHAKGLWLTVPQEEDPSVTVIGSSNYTKRAYSLDLETNAIIITKDETLKRRMKSEIDHLMEHATRLDLSDFEQSSGRALAQQRHANPVSENAVFAAESIAAVDDDAENVTPTASATGEAAQVNHDRNISMGVRLAVKILGGKL